MELGRSASGSACGFYHPAAGFSKPAQAAVLAPLLLGLSLQLCRLRPSGRPCRCPDKTLGTSLVLAVYMLLNVYY